MPNVIGNFLQELVAYEWRRRLLVHKHASSYAGSAIRAHVH